MENSPRSKASSPGGTLTPQDSAASPRSPTSGDLEERHLQAARAYVQSRWGAGAGDSQPSTPRKQPLSPSSASSSPSSASSPTDRSSPSSYLPGAPRSPAPRIFIPPQSPSGVSTTLPPSPTITAAHTTAPASSPTPTVSPSPSIPPSPTVCRPPLAKRGSSSAPPSIRDRTATSSTSSPSLSPSSSVSSLTSPPAPRSSPATVVSTPASTSRSQNSTPRLVSSGSSTLPRTPSGPQTPTAIATKIKTPASSRPGPQSPSLAAWEPSTPSVTLTPSTASSLTPMLTPNQNWPASSTPGGLRTPSEDLGGSQTFCNCSCNCSKAAHLLSSQDKAVQTAVDDLEQGSHTAGGSEKREHLYKILVIGELGTGKTSIIKRYVHQFFSQHYRATIGVDFALKVLNWDVDTLIRLQLWDIAGQERFGNMTRVYYREAVGAFVVFDVTRASTFEAVTKWKNDLDSKVQLPDGSPVPCVLLANKCDQAKEGLVNNTAQMDEFCREKGFVGWFETSAKENINIDEAARFLVTRILEKDRALKLGEEDRDRERILLDGQDPQSKAEKKSSCC